MHPAGGMNANLATSQEVKPSVAQVKDDPARFYGKRVTSTGEVEHVEDGRRSFELEGNGWLFEPELRVLTRPVPIADEIRRIEPSSS